MIKVFVAFVIGIGIGLIVMMMTRKTSVTSTVSPSNILGIKYTRGKSVFMDAIDNIENKIMPIAQGAMCNILHDPALMEMIPDEGGVKCSELITQIESEIEKFSDIIDGIDEADRSDIEEVQFILYTELLALIEVLKEKFCSDGETMIDAATVKSLINNVRDSVCDGFDIDPTTFKEYSEQVMKEGLATGKIFMKVQNIQAISSKK